MFQQSKLTTIIISSSTLLLLFRSCSSAFLVSNNPLHTNTAARTPNLNQYQHQTTTCLPLWFFERKISSNEAVDKSIDNGAWSVEKAGKTAPHDLNPHITIVESEDDFLSFLAEDDGLCIVQFHAAWCKSCQRFGKKFKRLAAQTSSSSEVRFAAVEFAKNVALCRSLGIKKLPYVHFYRGDEGKISDFVCAPKNFHLVESKLRECLGGTTMRGGDDEEEFERIMTEGHELGNDIVANLEESKRVTRETKADSN